MIITKALLVVIAANFITEKTHFFIQEYSSIQECEKAKKKVRTKMFKTWRYCHVF